MLKLAKYIITNSIILNYTNIELLAVNIQNEKTSLI